jgi:hypothetical protein
MADRPQLSGWGQIALHLGVSIRTAQVYERERGLPVHRMPGPMGRVWALIEELDAWKQGTKTEVASNRPAALSSDPTKLAPGSNRRLFLGMVTTSAAMLTGIVYGVARMVHSPEQPANWRVRGNTLAVIDRDGHEVWHYTFPVEMNADRYKDVRGFGNRCVFADLNGAGADTLFAYFPASEQIVRPALVCFNPRGQIRWQFSPDHNITDLQSRQWTPFYFPNNFVVISAPKAPPRVIVVNNHYWSFPTQVASLDSSGQKVSEFWHRGHLTHVAVADLDGDGAPEILLGGVNDAPEFKQATLLIFDCRSISGASSSPTGERYFRGFGPGTEKAEIFFPRTPVSKGQEFNRLTYILIGAGRITVLVGEGIGETEPCYVIYDFDFHLNVISATFSDPLKIRYRELEANGLIAEDSVFTDPERLKQQVRVLRRGTNSVNPSTGSL